MRQQDPIHQKRLLEVLELDAEDVFRQLEISDYEQPGYIPSEVLASLIRARSGLAAKTLEATTSALNRRIITGVKNHIWRNPNWRARAQRDSDFLIDAVQWFWEELINNKEEVCNAEVRFAIYLENRVHDLMRHAFAQKNMNRSIEEFVSTDEGEKRVDYLETIEDPEDDGPDDQVNRHQEQIILTKALLDLPRLQRQAFYFRLELEYDWKTVAQLLHCSIPTARKLKDEAVRRLDGELL